MEQCSICLEMLFIEETVFISKEAFCADCNLEIDRQFAKQFSI